MPQHWKVWPLRGRQPSGHPGRCSCFPRVTPSWSSPPGPVHSHPAPGIHPWLPPRSYVVRASWLGAWHSVSFCFLSRGWGDSGFAQGRTEPWPPGHLHGHVADRPPGLLTAPSLWPRARVVLAVCCVPCPGMAGWGQSDAAACPKKGWRD